MHGESDLMDEIFQNLTTSAKIDNNSDPLAWSPIPPAVPNPSTLSYMSRELVNLFPLI